jgi:hypothetical protein
MGQAKRRGTYEVRKTEAVERRRKASEEDAAKRAANPQPRRRHSPLAAMVAIAATLSPHR